MMKIMIKFEYDDELKSSIARKNRGNYLKKPARNSVVNNKRNCRGATTQRYSPKLIEAL